MPVHAFQTPTVVGGAKPVGIVDKVLDLSYGTTLSTVPAEVDSLLQQLVSQGPVADSATVALKQGQGVWEVFYAPHLRLGSHLFQTAIDPLRYTLAGDKIVTHVRTKNLLGTMWLSSSGRAYRHTDDTLKLEFDRFWFDWGEDSLREQLLEEEALMDKVVGSVGRAAFVSEIATFPIKFLDARLAVFVFPALDVKIAIRKVA